MATLQLRSGLTIACSCAFIPTTVVLTGLRFCTRRQQKASLGADDWLTLPASIFVLAMQIAMIAEIAKREIGYSDPRFVKGRPDASSNLPFWPFEMLQVLALSFIKLSIVFLYRRIFDTGAARLVRWVTLATIITITAWGISYFFSFLFICRTNFSDYWISAASEKKFCVKTQELHLSSAVSDAILDVIVLAIPLPMIWRLHMSMSKKFAVTGVFSLGLITVGASITRMVIFIQATALRYDPYLDFEYLITASIYWSMLEVGLGFIATNMVVIYSLLAHGSFRPVLRSLRSIMSIPRFNRVSSQEDGSRAYRTGTWTWPGRSSEHVQAPLKHVGDDVEELPLANLSSRSQRSHETDRTGT